MKLVRLNQFRKIEQGHRNIKQLKLQMIFDLINNGSRMYNFNELIGNRPCCLNHVRHDCN